MDLHGRYGALTATGGAEIWVCASCRSVNKLRAKQCYNCRTPKDRAAVDPLMVDVTSHGQVRAITLPDFRPSRPFALVASFLILAIGALQAINSVAGATLTLRVIEGDVPVEAEIVNAGILGLTTIGIGLVALTAWAAWLSKAVRVMPALGLGYPAANGLMAFVENFIPVLNLWRVPAIVRDIVVRLEPRESRGGALISAAWIGLIAGYLLPRFGAFVNRFRSGEFEDYVRNQVLVQLVSAGLVLVGSVFLVGLIWWIELRISRHRNLEPVSAPASGSAGATARAAPAAEVALGAAAPTAPPRAVPGPLGSMVVAQSAGVLASRPITALTGTAGSTSTTSTLAPAGPPESPDVRADPEADLQPAPEQAAEPALDPAAHLPEGPRLHLAVAHDGSMVATLDGESEPITFDELHDVAAALARADGSAIITIGGGTLEASTSASKAERILTDTGVPTAFAAG